MCICGVEAKTKWFERVENGAIFHDLWLSAGPTEIPIDTIDDDCYSAAYEVRANSSRAYREMKVFAYKSSRSGAMRIVECVAT
jgi:hypothetical protein